MTDASDLMRIHQASLLQDPDRKAVQEIVERKLAKQREVAQKQQEKLLRIMKERFSQYTVLKLSLIHISGYRSKKYKLCIQTVLHTFTYFLQYQLCGFTSYIWISLQYV